MARIGKLFLLVCVLWGLSGCRMVLYGERVSPEELGLYGELGVHGSTSMVKVTQALGEGFCEEYPGVRLQVSATGSGEAVYAVRTGSALIGNVSRSLRESEHPEQFEQVTLAMDGIVIAVHPENPICNLSTKEIAQIFSGEITNWSQIGGYDRPVTVLGREAASGTRDAFEEAFGLSDAAYEAELTSNGEIITRISSDRCAIGYLSMDSLNPSVKGMQVDGVAATEETIRNGRYRVKRPFLQICQKGSDSRFLNAWFAYVHSPQGQQRIRQAGLVPVGAEAGGTL